MPKTLAPRFGIGEWFGHSFIGLTPQKRKEYATAARKKPVDAAQPCPFVSASERFICNKKGGICSLRLYQDVGDGRAEPVEGADGKLRITCPRRFQQNDTVFSAVSEILIGTSNPTIIPEIRFLKRPVGFVADAPEIEIQDAKVEDVGNIDIVLVNSEGPELRWCALEIQAVYFSGEKMDLLFDHIESYVGDGAPFPDRVRRPDYRSSGPKRLMPQLQIKVPTLRRWGKKMALVVDVPWFRTNVVGVETVSDISNSDIAWFLVDFDESTDPATLIVKEPELQTLERAVEGLTGGFPVTLTEFESKIREKLRRLVSKPI
jgi:hypothetical protein